MLGPREHEGHDHRPVAPRPATIARRVAALLLLTTLAAAACAPSPVRRGEPAPDFSGTTLDGQTLRLADLRGRPVLVNFWGPSCIPCREEFPLFKAMLERHAGDGLVVVGVLMDDPPEPARDFVERFEATWPTVIDPDEAIVRAYLVAARPQTYFVDPDGIVRSIQVGEVVESDFERQYALIAP